MRKDRKNAIRVSKKGISRDSTLVREMFFAVSRVSMLMMLTTMIGTVVDGIVTGQYLGTDAVAATGLLSPVILIGTLFGTIIGSGMSLLCSRALGMADPEKMNQSFSLGTWSLLAIGVLLLGIQTVLAPSIAAWVGARGESAHLAPLISDYLVGFSFGYPVLYLCIGLSGMMQMDNDRKRALKAAAVELVVNVAGDFLNVLVFHGGLFGMALATSISHVAGLSVLLLHFRRPNILLKLTRRVNLRELPEMAALGLNNAISNLCVVARNMGINFLLLSLALPAAVAALSVANNLMNLVMSVCFGLSIGASTVASISDGERDGGNLRQLCGISVRAGTLLALLIGAVFIAGAPLMARLFLAGPQAALDKTAACIRFLSASFMFRVLLYPVLGILLGVRQKKLNYLCTVLLEGAYPLLFALAMGNLWGEAGVWWSIPAAGAAALITVLVIARIRKKAPLASPADLVPLALPAEEETDVWTASLKTMDDVAEASEGIRRFSAKMQADTRTQNMLSLFVEEMAGNTVQHGFGGKERDTVDLRLVKAENGWILRIRDNGHLFDPLAWLQENHPDDPTANVGIRIVVGTARSIQYIPMMNMNNLLIEI